MCLMERRNVLGAFSPNVRRSEQIHRRDHVGNFGVTGNVMDVQNVKTCCTRPGVSVKRLLRQVSQMRCRC